MTKTVLVVGGGPGGAAAAFWLARNGVEVHLVEKKRYPREKACGHALTPPAIRRLLRLGLASAVLVQQHTDLLPAPD